MSLRGPLQSMGFSGPLLDKVLTMTNRLDQAIDLLLSPPPFLAEFATAEVESPPINPEPPTPVTPSSVFDTSVDYPAVDTFVCAECEDQSLFRLANTDLDSQQDVPPCPSCSEAMILDEEANAMPIRSSVAYPRCVVIKPTFGPFHSTYSDTCLLHVGISDSRGRVLNFHNQVKWDAEWTECIATSVREIVVPFAHEEVVANTPVGGDPSEAFEALTSPVVGSPEDFDQALIRHAEVEMERVKNQPYHQMDNNCFDLVIRFLNANRMGSEPFTKMSFARLALEKPVDQIGEYLGVVRNRS